MTSRTAPSEIFADLRGQLFGSDLSQVAPPEDNSRDDRLKVYGVAMEGGLAGGSYLVFGLRDGSASLYLSTGGGSIGGQGRPRVDATAKAFVAAATAFAERLPTVNEYPLPSVGRVRFSIFTATGVRAAEAAEPELLAEKDALTPLFSAGQAIITEFRLLEQREAADEPSYLNCLLTALARGNGTSVMLDTASPLPDPAGLTDDKADLDWIAEIGFDRSKLSQGMVIKLLEREAGFSSLRFWQRERSFNVRLAAHGGESFTDVTFLVRRQREGNLQQVRVTVERPR